MAEQSLARESPAVSRTAVRSDFASFNSAGCVKTNARRNSSYRRVMPRELEALIPEPSEHRLEHVLQRELGDARPPLCGRDGSEGSAAGDGIGDARVTEFSVIEHRSEEHTSELQSLRHL